MNTHHFIFIVRVNRGFPARMAHLPYISCLRYTILVRNPQNIPVTWLLAWPELWKWTLIQWFSPLCVIWCMKQQQGTSTLPCLLLFRVPSGGSVFCSSLLSQWLLLVGCLTSQQHASVSQGRICSDNFMCCHTEIEVADQTFHLTQSQYTDTGPTSPSADPNTPGAWQGSHWSANFEVAGMTRPRKNPGTSGIRIQDLPLSRRTPYH